ncbi:O-antigen ligase [Elusimicrobium simillimum]|uniref:O-antigen ligase family protein n=1 Tax=Elusimicrobium simillimum TaxID=3143438 RepID=UPI003C6F11CB
MKKKTTVKTPQISNVKSMFLQNALSYVIAVTLLLITISFSIRTYDTSAVKTALLLNTFALTLVLWGAFHITVKKYFTREKLIALLPFGVFLIWLGISYLFNSYKLASVEEFVKNIMFWSFPLLLATCLAKRNVGVINKFFIISVWVCFIYGIVQTLDLYVFSGIDIMPWRGAFGKRVFATFANPNFFADFIVLSLFIIAANYLRTKEKKYIVLAVLGLVNLYFTESKGAWVSFGVVGALFTLSYTFFFAPSNKYAKAAKWSVLALCALALALTVIFSFKRAQSVNFRMVTWGSVLDMVKDAPVIGHGSGSFAYAYYKYKRPDIFYMEKLHNVETGHAENEFLEVLANNGIIGLAIFIWLIFALFWRGIKTLAEYKKFSSSLSPPYLLFGFMGAAAAVLVHNMFDISMRMASTGFILAVLVGLIIVLCAEDVEVQDKVFNANKTVLAVAAGLLFIIMIYLLKIVLVDINLVAGSSVESRDFGRGVLRFAFWIGALGVIGVVFYIYYKTIRVSQSLLAVLFMLLSLPMFFISSKYLLSDYYTNAALFFAQRQEWKNSMEFYTNAIKNNPVKVSLYHSRGSVTLNRWDMSSSYDVKVGDKDNVYRTDFDRASQDYQTIFRYSPNESMLHHHWGNCYINAGLIFTKRAIIPKRLNILIWRRNVLAIL